MRQASKQERSANTLLQRQNEPLQHRSRLYAPLYPRELPLAYGSSLPALRPGEHGDRS